MKYTVSDYYVQLPTLIVLQSAHFPRGIAVLYDLYIDFVQAIQFLRREIESSIAYK